MNPAGLG